MSVRKPPTPGGGYSTLSWVRMCGPKFQPPPYNKTREDANLLPISKPFVYWRALFKTNQCFLQCKLGCIRTFWQPIDKPKDKFIGNYAFCKNATYIKTNFQIKKGPLQNLRARKSTLSGPHIPVPTFPLSTPPGPPLRKSRAHTPIRKKVECPPPPEGVINVAMHIITSSVEIKISGTKTCPNWTSTLSDKS